MNFAQNSAVWGLNNILPLFNGATLTFYSGGVPASPETGVTTDTALCVFTFAATAFAAPAFSSNTESATATFTTSSVTPTASGTVTFARAGMVTHPWTASATYAQLYTVVVNSANYYILTKAGTAAASGGPSGTAFLAPVADNSAQWTFYSPTTGVSNVLADFIVGTATSGNDIVIGSTAITTSVNVSITSFVLQTSAV
jgi:hypothetical protein